MGEIYKHCLVNIAATASKDSEGGLFFDRNPTTVQPLQVTSRFPPHDLSQPAQHYDVVMSDMYDSAVGTAPLNCRG
jgi:hypothetical protein